VHGWWTGGEWEWYKPIFAGDEFNVVCVVRELVGKEGKMGGGRTWLDYGDNIFVNQKGEIVGKERSLVILAKRGASGSAGKVRAIPKPEYSSEDWIKILELYDKEELRGAEPRYWEDVEVGEKHPDFSGADIGNICG
jgi:hydroxyacyl-ACP dehydratase HTD2-like protein with hotdog domain